jgi:hypothetical protein
MQAHDNRPESADVVAVFDSQDDADEAVLELREIGVRDDHIGYFSYTPDGGAINLLDRNYWFAGATLGTIVGGALGAWIARLVAGWVSPYGDLDPWGLVATCIVFAALFGAFAGGLIGMGISRRGVAAPMLGPDTGPFVVAVSAGEARDQVWAVLRRHGGHELSAAAHPGHLPAAHSA